MQKRLNVFIVLVFLSGFSGLVYEVVWQRYLTILLGAQAWATAIILSVFLGGLSAGYFLFGRLTRGYKGNLLSVYTGVEMGMALWAFLFPFLFDLAFQVVPVLQKALGVGNVIVDIGTSVFLLGIPTVLMGGTLPLLTQALSSGREDASEVHAKIYGFNTLGACFGCLCAGLWWIPSFGLGWTTGIAGAVNAAVAVAVFSRRGFSVRGKGIAKGSREKLSTLHFVLIGTGFVSGFYVLAIQSILIRLMGLAVGASNYSFAIVVACFVFSLGLGSLIVRRFSRFTMERLFWNQLYAALAIFILYLSGDYWSYGAHLVRIFLRDIPQAFAIYQAALGVALFGVLVIPLALCGITLPLCFHLIKGPADRLGQRVGWLYGANTLGCIAGALVGGYWLLNYLDLDQVFKLCVLCVLFTSVGAAFLSKPWDNWGTGRLVYTSAIVSILLAGVILSPLYHKERFLQPFRNPRPFEASFSGAGAFGARLSRSSSLLLWKDGPTASLGIGAAFYQGKEVSRTIYVNGKSDGNTRGDQLTTVLLGHLPGLLAAHPRRTCVIGFGTGTTVGALLAYPQVESVDVVEISGTVIRNASMFDSYNGLASKSPKVHFHETDAMRFLGSGRERYDAIVSEPSNPWVSGVENLFSKEFYQRASQSLLPGGMLVQWVHTYSFTEDLFKMVAGTLGSVFPYVSVFQLKGGDYALVATLEPLGREATQRGLQRYGQLLEVRADLFAAGVTSYELLLALEVMGPSTVREMADGLNTPHTLTHPRLSDAAAKAFFVGQSVDLDEFRRGFRGYYRFTGKSLLREFLGSKELSPKALHAFQAAFCDDESIKTGYLCRESVLLSRLVEPQVATPKRFFPDEDRALASVVAFRSASKERGDRWLQGAYERFDAFKKYASPIFHVSRERLLEPISGCLAGAPHRSELWGQCVLQKILVLEWFDSPIQEVHAAKKAYFTWFDALDPDDPKQPNYGKLKEARDILAKGYDTKS